MKSKIFILAAGLLYLSVTLGSAHDGQTNENAVQQKIVTPFSSTGT